MQAPLPLTRELVLIGGGHTHALVLRRWGMNPLPGARLTLIDPGPTAPYTGMLPGHVAGHYSRDALDIDLVRLARFAGARLILGRADAIDLARRRIRIAGRGEIVYHVASLDVGITSGLPDLPGYAQHAVSAKPLGRYAAAWARFRQAIARGAAQPRVAVIGGGVGGVELSLAMAHALRGDGADPRIAVIERDTALPGLTDRARDRLRAAMAEYGIALAEHAEVASVGPKALTLADGREIPADFTVGAAGARPHTWLDGTGLALENGFVRVDATLRSSDPHAFAVGDCAHLDHAPRPKAGVYAVRAAPTLHANLRAALTGRPRRAYRPQRDYLKLISLGGKAALTDKWGVTLSGRWLWRLKDRIDRRFMAKFTDLPAMRPPPLPREVAAGVREDRADGKPLCGGCGAKIGGATLAAVLARLPEAGRDDVLTRPGDDAAVLRTGTATQAITTDHLRAVTLDPWLHARIAAVHALGDVWAMGARPQAALATVILPRMSAELQQAWLDEIMAAAGAVFAAEGAAIVGGHTSLGDELTVGFAVTGLCEGPPVTLAGARPGDALLLTKPLGSGTVLAAEMALQARGDWVAAALASMARPQGAAAEALAGAHAMTDVTGFGLAGHLLALCDASRVAAEIDLDRVPLLDGAEELAARGVRSTLYPANAEAAARMTLPDDPRADLLFDPQTAGGLLAALPAAAAETALERIRDAGFDAKRIGRIVEGVPHLFVR